MEDIGTNLQQLLKSFTPEQLEFVAQRILVRSDKQAAEDAEIPYNTVTHWENKKDINEAVKLAKMDSVEVAREKLRRLTPRAVDVLDDEMVRGRKRRLDAACQVLDRSGLEAKKGVDLTSKGKRMDIGIREVVVNLTNEPKEPVED